MRIVWRIKGIKLLFVLAIGILGLFSEKAFTQEHSLGRQLFDANWRFHLGDLTEAKTTNFDDRNWRSLDLPHDWSIEGEFSKEHPATNQGGALPGGIAWYRKSFVLPANKQGKQVYIDFDGIYRDSEVWINGHYLGKRPSGYTSFRYDISPFLLFGKSANVIAVRVDNSQQPNSRWYSGSGIYRHVWLVEKNKIELDHWGIKITTPVVGPEQALLQQEVSILNGDKPVEVELGVMIFDQQGKLVAQKKEKQLLRDSITKISYQLTVPNPMLWSPEHPDRYQVRTQILLNKQVLDEQVVPIGIREFSFDAQKGFALNGLPTKILGVCMHHDLGALGAAINKRAMERQLEILKSMGTNAIRLSHNPPAPEFLDLCDSMGFLVMDEAFDMWRKKKNKFDYSLDFDQWHRQDLVDLIKRDRNHPSIILWSIGNEIREQFDSTGTSLTKELVGIVKSEDSTRPVLAALTETHLEKNFIAQAETLDLLGFNYKYDQYDSLPIQFPNTCLIASETTSALETRGHYDLGHDTLRFWPPSSEEKFVKNGNSDFTVSAYDNVAAYWGTSHERAWLEVKKRDFLAGLFVWTGFDYLGEPVPYDFPARSSYYGIVDLAGFPKDVYYMYQSEWTDKPVLHLLPHWNWKDGQVVDVWAYYSQADEVELFLNNRSLGTRHKEDGELHVSWKVPFEPGKLKIVSRKQGKEVLSKTVNTAGAPAKVRLSVDRQTLRSGIQDLAFASVEILDSAGNLVPDAQHKVRFELEGPGMIAGVDNGFQADLTSLKGNKKAAYNGKCLGIVQATSKGKIRLKAVVEGLEGAELDLMVK